MSSELNIKFFCPHCLEQIKIILKDDKIGIEPPTPLSHISIIKDGEEHQYKMVKLGDEEIVIEDKFGDSEIAKISKELF